MTGRRAPVIGCALRNLIQGWSGRTRKVGAPANTRRIAWGRQRGILPGAQLIGKSKDDPDITPMKKYEFDWCLVLPPGVKANGEVNDDVIPANRFAVVRCTGDVHKADRLWRYVFQTWLPGSGYQPADEPLLEVYRRTPLELGSELCDVD